jgi:acyl-CoA dehydrogenase
MTWSPDLAAVVDDVFADTDETQLWATVVDLDWTTVGVTEDVGGAGGDLRDQAELAHGVGRHAVAIPLWETAHAAWALSRAGLELPARGQAAVVVHDLGEPTPWLGTSKDVVLVRGHELVRLPEGLPSRQGPPTVADEPTLLLDVPAELPGEKVALRGDLAAEIRGRGALLRAVAIHGAMSSACELTREHVVTREQFGRPLVVHQAVAHTLADMVLARDRVRAGIAEALDRGDPGTAMAARAAAAAAAGPVAASAHQLLGAMGTTREHPLHHFTRRLWSWRDAGGSQRAWEQRVGQLVLAGEDDDELWRLVAG